MNIFINSYDVVPSEEDVIQNSKLEHLYSHEFGDGRFFQVVFSNENETHIKLAPRTLMQVTYLKKEDDLDGIEIVKLISNKEKQRVKFSKFNLQQLKCFLHFISSLDLKGINERRIKLSDNTLGELDEETKKKISTLLSGEDGGDLVSDLLKQGLVTSKDIVNTGYRKQQLQLFSKLLYENGLTQYKEKNNIKLDEKAWQHFFQHNEWIFGYGLDYKFQGILQKEFHASDTNAAGKNGVIGDFLLGEKKFTTFVEIKLPSTKLFGSNKNRSNSWTLSNKLIEAYSQILEQKASGQIKINTKELFNDAGQLISQNAYDSKTILIIGCWNQISSDVPETKKIKEKTFELFRRDSRNIDIITYDELYDRACFIVNNN